MPPTSHRTFFGAPIVLLLAFALAACAAPGGNGDSLARTHASSKQCLGTYSYRSSDQHVNLPGLPNLSDNSTNSTVTPTPVDAVGCPSTDPDLGSCIDVAEDQLRLVVRNGHVAISDPSGRPLLATGQATGNELRLTWMTNDAGSRSVVFDFRCGEDVR